MKIRSPFNAAQGVVLKYVGLGLFCKLLLICVAPAVAQKPQLNLQTGHREIVNTLAFSPKGELLASCSQDTRMILWDVKTGRKVREFRGSSEGCQSVAFRPDGKVLATGDYHGTVSFWDAATGKRLRELRWQGTGEGQQSDVEALVFSSDGSKLATLDAWGIKIWDMGSFGELRSLRGHYNIECIAFSPDGKTLASGSSGYGTWVWDIRTGNVRHRLRPNGFPVHSLSFQPDGHVLATGDSARIVRLWDTNTGRELRSFGREQPGTVVKIAFINGGELAFADVDEGTIQFLNIQTGKISRTIHAATAKDKVSSSYSRIPVITSICVSPDGKLLASTGINNALKLWDIRTGQLNSMIDANPTNSVASLALDSAAPKLASGYSDGTIRLWDLNSGTVVKTFKASEGGASSIMFSADGKKLVSGGTASKVNLWDVSTGKVLRSFDGQERFSDLLAVAISKDGTKVASCGWDNTVKVWDAESGARLYVLTGHDKVRNYDPNEPSGVIANLVGEFSAGVLAVAFSPNGDMIASGGLDSTVKLWNATTGKEIDTLRAHGSVDSVAFNSDGTMLASASKTGELILWDIPTRKPLRVIDNRRLAINPVVFSPDNLMVAAGTAAPDSGTLALRRNSMVAVWNSTLEKEVLRFEGHHDEINAVTFSADSKFIVSGSSDGTIKIWDVMGKRELATLIDLPQQGSVVIDPEGRFDAADLDYIKGLHWLMPDDPFTPLPFEIFMRPYYEPRLLPRLLADEDFREVPSLSDLNRVQPKVTITDIKKDGADTTAVTVLVENVAHRYEREKNPIAESGAKDLRLFRDGQLVSYRDGNLLDGQERNPTTGCEPIAGSGRKCRAIFERIRLPRRKDVTEVEFSAYAFNTSDVKSETSRFPFKFTAELPTKKSRVYLITAGVSKYENPAWNLQFAANDAHLIDETLSAKLRATGDYEDVINVMLTSEERLVNSQTELVKTATKQNFRNILRLLAGEKLAESETKEIPNAHKIEKATPEDVVLIFYSSHGYRDDERFYLFPYDIGPGEGRDPEAVAPQSISSDDLYRWLRDIDAGDMVLVIDACHAAAVTGRDFKPGPMGSRGMGQLAYDKGMRILAATQPDTTAAEVENLNEKRKIQHGLLTYALVEDGLIARQADSNDDKVILISEWLEFGVSDVPKLFNAAANNQDAGTGQPTVQSQSRGTSRVRFISRGDGDTSTQQPSLFDFTEKVRSKRQLLVDRLLR